MKLQLLLSAAVGCISFALAEAPAIAQRPASPAELAAVVGYWHAEHIAWKDIIAIRSDGTFSRPAGEGGTWKLTSQLEHPVLELNWKGSAANTLDSESPNLFRGPTSGGVSVLRRLATKHISFPSAERAEPIENAALKAALKESVWQLPDGKRFTLHAGGTTTSSWHARGGSWRTTGPNKIQLAISLKALMPPGSPETVTIEEDSTLLRWSDADGGLVAFRLVAAPDEQ